MLGLIALVVLCLAISGIGGAITERWSPNLGRLC
jgi:hypothetical protein